MVSSSPVLFIHGASCDARIWRNGFLQSFEHRGWRCRAIDLPGHGMLRADGAGHALGLADYARAIAEAVDDWREPPILIGHSMGGYLAQQHVLSGGRACAVVLLASAPPQGMLRDALGFLLRHPALALRLDLAGGRGDRNSRLRRVRSMLMTEATPTETVAQVADLLQPESLRAIRELGMVRLPARPLAIPLLAVAGGQDRLIGVGSQRAMAKRYGISLQVFAAMGHMLPVEPGWQQIADTVCDFLAVSLPPGRSGTAEEQVGAA
jgi:non-heme chloroperoxidase